METSRLVLRIEALLLLLAFLAAWLPGRMDRTAKPLWWLAAVAGLIYAGMRYWVTWPMSPMFAGSILYPPLLVILGISSLRGSDPESARVLRRWLMACGLITLLVGICFPKDFYLPMIKTTSFYAQGLLVFGMFARACLFVAAGWALAALLGHKQVMQRMFRWTIWGFGLWTLSLFSGEVWSYSGWGVPMVWEDASTLTAIATWLYYVGFIHLHLSGLGNRKGRALMNLLGTILILVLNGGPDMGPFRNPLAVMEGA